MKNQNRITYALLRKSGGKTEKLGEYLYRADAVGELERLLCEKLDDSGIPADWMSSEDDVFSHMKKMEPGSAELDEALEAYWEMRGAIQPGLYSLPDLRLLYLDGSGVFARGDSELRIIANISEWGETTWADALAVAEPRLGSDAFIAEYQGQDRLSLRRAKLDRATIEAMASYPARAVVNAETATLCPHAFSAYADIEDSLCESEADKAERSTMIACGDRNKSLCVLLLD